MTCYVDTVREYPEAGLRHTAWCHLLADGREELHAFAGRLGLPRRAFQDHAWRWHYDLPGPLRPAAVDAGAREVDFHTVALLLRARRAAALGQVGEDRGDRGDRPTGDDGTAR